MTYCLGMLVLLVLHADRDAAAGEAVGESAAALAPETPRLQVTLLSPQDGNMVSEPVLKLRVMVRAAAGSTARLSALIDGKPVTETGRGLVDAVAPPVSANAQGAIRDLQTLHTLTVHIPAANCNLAVVAQTATESATSATVRLNWTGPRGVLLKPTLYVLAIGVGAYPDRDLALGFASKDASDFAGAFAAQQGGLYERVVTKVLLDKQATRDNVLDALQWVQQQTTAKDVAVLYFAGHGIDDPSSGTYYFLPYDADPKAVRRTMLAQQEIQLTLRSIAGKTLLFLDTCHAASVLQGAKGRAVTDISHLLTEMVRAENGVVVYAAATGRQQSQESAKWGNGAFTKAVVEGLQGKAAYSVDKRITAQMLYVYVSERVKELTAGTQTPIMLTPEAMPDFPLALAGQEVRSLPAPSPELAPVAANQEAAARAAREELARRIQAAQPRVDPEALWGWAVFQRRKEDMPGLDYRADNSCHLSANPYTHYDKSRTIADWGRLVGKTKLRLPPRSPLDEAETTLYEIAGQRRRYLVPDAQGVLAQAAVGELIFLGDPYPVERTAAKVGLAKEYTLLQELRHLGRIAVPPRIAEKGKWDPIHLSHADLDLIVTTAAWDYPPERYVLARLLIEEELGGGRFRINADPFEKHTFILELPPGLPRREVVKRGEIVWAIMGRPRVDQKLKQLVFSAVDIESRYLLEPGKQTADYQVSTSCRLAVDLGETHSARAVWSDWGPVVSKTAVRIPRRDPADTEQAITLLEIAGKRERHVMRVEQGPLRRAAVGDLVFVCDPPGLPDARLPAPWSHERLTSDVRSWRLAAPPRIVDKGQSNPLHLILSDLHTMVRDAQRGPPSLDRNLLARITIGAALGQGRFDIPTLEGLSFVLEVPAALPKRELVKPGAQPWVIMSGAHYDHQLGKLVMTATDIESHYVSERP